MTKEKIDELVKAVEQIADCEVYGWEGAVYVECQQNADEIRTILDRLGLKIIDVVKNKLYVEEK